MSTFQEHHLDSRLLRALDDLGFQETTEAQKQALPIIAEGRDLMLSAKTGSGKTAAFILPMLNRFLLDERRGCLPRGLILLPTRELAIQTQKMFENLAAHTDITCGLILGGEPSKPQLAMLKSKPSVVIATPGRLFEHVGNARIDLSAIDVLVLDEADRMLDMGFSETVDAIVAACNKERQNLLFSATLKSKGFGRITRFLDNPVRLEIDSLRDGHSQISQQFVLTDDDRHKENVVAALIAEEGAQHVFVFCNTRLQAQKVSNMLSSKKLRACYIHGEVSQEERKKVLERFRSGVLQVLVATDLAARGLDVKDVDLVINFTVPHSGDDHVHRVGRTGRASQEGTAITLVNSLEWNRMSSIERYLKIRFTPRKIKGLEAAYTGPKKLKKSGKAAGVKKKKRSKAIGSKKGNTKKKVKTRKR